MIKWLVELKGWAAEDAYTFCSIACDLRVTQLVDGFKGIRDGGACADRLMRALLSTMTAMMAPCSVKLVSYGTSKPSSSMRSISASAAIQSSCSRPGVNPCLSAMK